MRGVKIITGRLILRPFAEGDLADYAALIRDKMASEYSPYDYQWPTDDASMGDVLKFVMGEEMWLAVELRATGRVVGFIHTGRADDDATRGLGYTIRSDYQNNGYAYEACRALMEHCISKLGTQLFKSGTADCNIPSVKLLHKLGFTKFRSFEASFAKDVQGKPITFAAGEYERIV